MSNKWKVYALVNHDLEQIFIGATDRPDSELTDECNTVAGEIVDWQKAKHNIECIETVESFPNWRSTMAYVSWLERDGAFSSVEHYLLGVDPAFA